LEGLGVRVVVVPFAPRPDVADGVVVALSPISPPEIIAPATTSVAAIVMTVAVVIPAARVVGTSIIAVLVVPPVVAAIIAAASDVVGAWESSGVFFQLQVGVLSVRPLLYHLQEVVDGGRPFAKELVPEVIMVA
jgi:hypothetical protein